MFDLLIVGFWIRSGHLDQVTPNLAFPSKGKCPLLELITTSTNKRVLFFHFKGAILYVSVPIWKCFLIRPFSVFFIARHRHTKTRSRIVKKSDASRILVNKGQRFTIGNSQI